MYEHYRSVQRIKSMSIKQGWLRQLLDKLFGTAQNKEEEKQIDGELNEIIDVLLDARNTFDQHMVNLGAVHGDIENFFNEQLPHEIRKAGPTIWKRVNLNTFIDNFVKPFLGMIIPIAEEEWQNLQNASDVIMSNIDDKINYLMTEVDKEYFKSMPDFEEMEAFLSDVDTILEDETETNITDYPDVEWESFYIDGSTPEQAVSEVFGFEGSKFALKAFGSLEGDIYKFLTSYQNNEYELPFPEDAVEIDVSVDDTTGEAEVLIEGESIFPYDTNNLRTNMIDAISDWGYDIVEFDLEAAGSGYDFKEYNIYIVLMPI